MVKDVGNCMLICLEEMEGFIIKILENFIGKLMFDLD